LAFSLDLGDPGADHSDVGLSLEELSVFLEFRVAFLDLALKSESPLSALRTEDSPA
jgi:hypothetical protein